MIQKCSSDFTDDDLRVLINDPARWQMIRNTNIALWEALERRALKLGYILQLRHGQPEPKKRGVTWEDPEFRGF